MTVTTSSGTVPPYPQPRLRIVANYRAGQIGEFLPPGQPENIEIEVNDPLGGLAEFVDSLVASLFRHGPADVAVDFTGGPAAPVDSRTGVQR